MDGKSVVHIPSFAVTMNARAVMSLNVETSMRRSLPAALKYR